MIAITTRSSISVNATEAEGFFEDKDITRLCAASLAKGVKWYERLKSGYERQESKVGTLKLEEFHMSLEQLLGFRQVFANCCYMV